MKYIDTSVILAALDPLDPKQKPAREILERNEDKVISELVILELASVLTRREILKKLKRKLGLREELILPTVLLYLMKRFKLCYGKANGHLKIPELGELYTPIATAISISQKLRLKTLDLLHVAYAKVLKIRGESIDTLITADEDLANKVIKELDIRVEVLKKNISQKGL